MAGLTRLVQSMPIALIRASVANIFNFSLIMIQSL